MINLTIAIEIQKASAHVKASLRDMQSVSRKNLFKNLLRRLCIKNTKKKENVFILYN